MNCLDVICRAMRRIGVLEAGALPDETAQGDALDTLKALYRRLITDGALGELVDVTPVATPYKAAPGQRVIGSLLEVNLPDTAPDCALICSADPTTGIANEYIFDARRQTWDSINALTLTSEAILAERDALGLLCYLALELADEYGQQPSEITVCNAARFQMSITHNWSTPAITGKGVYF